MNVIFSFLIAEISVVTDTFEEIIADIPITFHIIKMKECLFVWISDKGNFENLAVAMKTPYNSVPISTSIMGHFADDNSSALATKLSKKTGKQVFASCNLSKSDNEVLLSISKRLMQELASSPDKF